MTMKKYIVEDFRPNVDHWQDSCSQLQDFVKGLAEEGWELVSVLYLKKTDYYRHWFSKEVESE